MTIHAVDRYTGSKPMQTQQHRPGIDNNRPIIKTHLPGIKIHRPGINIRQPGIKILRPGFKVHRPDIEIHRPGNQCPPTGGWGAVERGGAMWRWGEGGVYWGVVRWEG
jgi:hypothetical protein